MGVAVGDVHALVAHPVGDRDRGEAQVDQKRDMAVPQVMDPYLFHTGKLRSGFQRVAERVLREGEEAVVFLDVAFHLHVLLEFLREEAGQGDHSLGLLGLRRADDVPSVEAGVGLRHADGSVLNVDVLGGQGQQLALPQAAPVENLVGVEHLGPVDDLLGEPQVLVRRPEPHLLSLLLTDPSGFLKGVCGKSVMPYGVVEDCGELVLHRSDVGLRELLPVLVLCLQQAVLPVHDLFRCDVDDPHLAEERDELLVDHVLLAAPCGLPQPRTNVFRVDPDELLEGHARGPRFIGQKVPLPCQGLALGLEASLRRVDGLSVMVRVVELDEPGAPLLVLPNAHRRPLSRARSGRFRRFSRRAFPRSSCGSSFPAS